MGDQITHPPHYCEGRKYEPKDVIRDWGLNFNLGNVIKYISRAGRKKVLKISPLSSDMGGLMEDLYKARQYLNYEIGYLESEVDKMAYTE